jgi:hypothetical protein
VHLGANVGEGLDTLHHSLLSALRPADDR